MNSEKYRSQASRDQRKVYDKQRYKHSQSNRDRLRNNQLKYDYGITLEQYNQMVIDQNNQCKICNKVENSKDYRGKTRQLAVDHCHTTNKVRGLLCGACNRALGLFKDDPEYLLKAYQYIKEQNDG